jgi:hypothetical protein
VGTGCHGGGASATSIHDNSSSEPAVGCAARHAAEKPALTRVCSTCHFGGGGGSAFPPGHPQPSDHNIISNGCTGGGNCHGTSVYRHGDPGMLSLGTCTNCHGSPIGHLSGGHDYDGGWNCDAEYCRD